MNIIVGIVVFILFLITLIMFCHTFKDNDKPFGMTMWLFSQMWLDFVVAIYLFKI